jgi:hypothetical protein
VDEHDYIVIEGTGTQHDDHLMDRSRMDPAVLVAVAPELVIADLVPTGELVQRGRRVAEVWRPRRPMPACEVPGCSRPACLNVQFADHDQHVCEEHAKSIDSVGIIGPIVFKDDD